MNKTETLSLLRETRAAFAALGHAAKVAEYDEKIASASAAAGKDLAESFRDKRVGAKPLPALTRTVIRETLAELGFEGADLDRFEKDGEAYRYLYNRLAKEGRFGKPEAATPVAEADETATDETEAEEA